jgi:hypothetical protein
MSEVLSAWRYMFFSGIGIVLAIYHKCLLYQKSANCIIRMVLYLFFHYNRMKKKVIYPIDNGRQNINNYISLSFFNTIGSPLFNGASTVPCSHSNLQSNELTLYPSINNPNLGYLTDNLPFQKILPIWVLIDAGKILSCKK